MTTLSAMLGMDVQTLVAVLFWGNLVYIPLTCWFVLATPALKGKKFFAWIIAAKFCQACAYWLLLSRGILPDILSVNAGNSLLFFGFFFESLCLLSCIEEDSPGNIRLMAGIAILTVAGFNLAETASPGSASLRVVLASVCVFALFLLPTLKMLLGSRRSAARQAIGVLYLFFLALLLPRAAYALNTSAGVLDGGALQTLTYLAMVLLLLFSPTAYVLLIKESADKKLHAMAMTDALTGLINRRNFTLHAQHIFTGSMAKKSPLALLFVDIDDFKRVNDTYGHAFGDIVLIRFANLLKNCLRTVDISCRYGGEEFVILLPRTTLKMAKVISHRIMRQTGELRFDEQPGFTFSVSIGLVAVPPHTGKNMDDCLGQADCAMYEAKKAGKNRVTVYRGQAGTDAARARPQQRRKRHRSLRAPE